MDVVDFLWSLCLCNRNQASTTEKQLSIAADVTDKTTTNNLPDLLLPVKPQRPLQSLLNSLRLKEV